jgi:hypothetical protein
VSGEDSGSDIEDSNELEDSGVFEDNPLTDENEDVRAPDTELQVLSSIKNSPLQSIYIIGNCYATSCLFSSNDYYNFFVFRFTRVHAQ